MTMAMRRRAAELYRQLPGAFMMALLTAAVTIILAIVISTVVGGDNNQHRLATRCFAHQTTTLIREIVEASDTLRDRVDLDAYPPIDITGVDCSLLFEQPGGHITDTNGRDDE